MNVFISYGGALDQATALRLQALGAINAQRVYVPPAYTRRSVQIELDSEASEKIRNADVILGVIGEGLSEACRRELNEALALRKHTIVMAYPPFAEMLRPTFGLNLIEVNPANPGAAAEAVGRIISHVKGLDLQQNTTTTLIALGTLALGLLIFAAVTNKES